MIKSPILKLVYQWNGMIVKRHAQNYVITALNSFYKLKHDYNWGYSSGMSYNQFCIFCIYGAKQVSTRRNGTKTQ